MFALLMLTTTAAMISTTGLDAFSSLLISGGLAVGFSFVKTPGLSLVSVCGKLTEDILKDCDTPLQAGTRDKLKIVNFADVLSFTRNATTGAIEGITLASGAAAITIDGQRNSIVPRSEQVTQGVFTMYDHEITAMGFDFSAQVKKDLEAGKDGQYIGFVENYFKGTAGNAAFEIYGLENGLELTGVSREANNADTQGAISLRFYTDVNKEPRMPATLFLTDYATSKAIFDGL